MANEVWCLPHKLLQSMSQDEMRRLAPLLTESKYGARSIIFEAGDPGDRVYFVWEGHVRLYRAHEDGKEISLGILSKGDIFGELALFGVTERQTFAESMDNVTLCSARTNDFLRVMSHMPQLTLRIAEIVGKRRLLAEMLVDGLAHATVRGRLLMVLRRLVEDFGAPCEGGTRINLRLSHQDLASLAGTTRETCSLEMGILQRQGIVHTTGEHYIVVPDVQKLAPGVIDRIRGLLKVGG